MLKKLLSYSLVFILTSISPIVEVEAKKVKPPVQTSLVVDAKTGKILHAKNSKIRIYPASLTKLMTLYLMFDAIEAGKLSLNTKMLVSKKAANMPPTKLGVKAGEMITVREAIPALIIKSANDVGVVVAENMRGSEQAFTRLMNAKAKKLRMKDTNFKNASGWHDPAQYTTAHDLAKLSLALKKDHPRFYSLFAKDSFVYRGNVITGHNRVTQSYQGAEGLKTGYTSPAGFNLATTASRNGKSLIAIVTGGKTAKTRDQQMIELLDKYFQTPKNIKLVSNNTKMNLKPSVKILPQRPLLSPRKRGSSKT